MAQCALQHRRYFLDEEASQLGYRDFSKPESATYRNSDSLLQVAPSYLRDGDPELDVHQKHFKNAWNVCGFNSTGWSDIMGSWLPDQNLMDTKCLCASVTKIPSGCEAGLDPTKSILWWNATCGDHSGILPAGWQESLVISNSSYFSEVGHEVVEVKLWNMGRARTANGHAKNARAARKIDIELEQMVLGCIKSLMMEANGNGSIQPDNPDLQIPLGPLRDEYNSWHALLNNCAALSAFWADIERCISQIPAETKAELEVREQQLGVKDLWAAQKRLAALSASVDAVRRDGAGGAGERMVFEKYNNLRWAITTYEGRYRGYLDARLAASTARRHDVEERLRHVPRQENLPRTTPVVESETLLQQARQTMSGWRMIRKHDQHSNLDFAARWAQMEGSWQDLIESWDRVSQSWIREIQILDRWTAEMRNPNLGEGKARTWSLESDTSWKAWEESRSETDCRRYHALCFWE